MRSLLAFSLGLFVTAAAADTSITMTGTMSAQANNGLKKTVYDSVTITTQTDARGLPKQTDLEVIGNDTTTWIFDNATPLADGTGYTMDMSGAPEGGTMQKLGTVTAQYQMSNGLFALMTFNNDIVIGGGNQYFLAGTGKIIQNPDGSITLQRDEKIVDMNGTEIESLTSTDRATP